MFYLLSLLSYNSPPTSGIRLDPAGTWKRPGPTACSSTCSWGPRRSSASLSASRPAQPSPPRLLWAASPPVWAGEWSRPSLGPARRGAGPLPHFWPCTFSCWHCFLRGSRLSVMNCSTDCQASLTSSADILLSSLRWKGTLFFYTADIICVLESIHSVSPEALFHHLTFSFIFSIPFPHLPIPASFPLSNNNKTRNWIFSDWIIFWFLLFPLLHSQTCRKWNPLPTPSPINSSTHNILVSSTCCAAKDCTACGILVL